MLRTRLFDLRLSDLPKVVNLCQSDVNGVASVVNTVQRRLLYCREAQDEGWHGTWAEVTFNVDPTSPYITTPREIARLEQMTVCRRPVNIRNQFYEYEKFGNGRLPKLCGPHTGCLDAYSRNNSVTFVDPPVTPFLLRIYPSSGDDLTSRVLVQGVDINGLSITSADGTNQVQGQFVTLEQPFVAFPFSLSAITGIQKDITKGQIQFKAVDPATGTETLLLTMEPGEQTAWYRRYYLNALPPTCCPTPNVPQGTTVQVTAIAKLDFIPVQVDTDYCLLQNIEAMIEEAQSMKYSRIDETSSKQMSVAHHANAVRFLNGELWHLYGKNDVSVNFKPFGSASLERQRIGSLV